MEREGGGTNLKVVASSGESLSDSLSVTNFSFLANVQHAEEHDEEVDQQRRHHSEHIRNRSNDLSAQVVSEEAREGRSGTYVLSLCGKDDECHEEKGDER